MSPYYRPSNDQPKPPQGYTLNPQMTGEIDPVVGGQTNATGLQPNQEGAGSVWSGEGVNYGTAALGLASSIGDTIAETHKKLGLPQFDNNLQYSNGRPSYSGAAQNSLSGVQVRSNKLNEKNWQSLIGGTTKGFASGYGTGGLYGAFVGGSIETFKNSAGAVGVQHKREQREKDRAMATVGAYQRNYNTASQSADQTDNAQADYSRRLSNSKRFSNLYRLPAAYQY